MIFTHHQTISQHNPICATHTWTNLGTVVLWHWGFVQDITDEKINKLSNLDTVYSNPWIKNPVWKHKKTP